MWKIVWIGVALLTVACREAVSDPVARYQAELAPFVAARLAACGPAPEAWIEKVKAATRERDLLDEFLANRTDRVWLRRTYTKLAAEGVFFQLIPATAPTAAIDVNWERIQIARDLRAAYLASEYPKLAACRKASEALLAKMGEIAEHRWDVQ